MNIRTVVYLDGFYYASDDYWNDATFTCRHDKAGWRRLPEAAVSNLKNVITDLLPEYDGENIRLIPPVEVNWYREEES